MSANIATETEPGRRKPASKTVYFPTIIDARYFNRGATPTFLTENKCLDFLVHASTKRREWTKEQTSRRFLDLPSFRSDTKTLEEYVRQCWRAKLSKSACRVQSSWHLAHKTDWKRPRIFYFSDLCAQPRKKVLKYYVCGPTIDKNQNTLRSLLFPASRAA